MILGDGHVGQPSGTLGRPHSTPGKQNGESHGMGNWIGIILVKGSYREKFHMLQWDDAGPSHNGVIANNTSFLHTERALVVFSKDKSTCLVLHHDTWIF